MAHDTLCFALMAILTLSAQYVVSDKYDLWFEDTNNEMTTRKLDTYSYENPAMSGNGCFCVKQGSYWYAVDQDGDKISGVYGDDIFLLNNGTWKCIRGSYVTYVE